MVVIEPRRANGSAATLARDRGVAVTNRRIHDQVLNAVQRVLTECERHSLRCFVLAP